jgi:hypothetical protein
LHFTKRRHYGLSMTIDERIERLTERHEALAQAVELLNHAAEALRQSITETNEILRLNSERTDAKILALLTLAGLHQKRLDDLRRPRLTRSPLLKLPGEAGLRVRGRG